MPPARRRHVTWWCSSPEALTCATAALRRNQHCCSAPSAAAKSGPTRGSLLNMRRGRRRGVLLRAFSELYVDAAILTQSAGHSQSCGTWAPDAARNGGGVGPVESWRLWWYLARRRARPLPLDRQRRPLRPLRVLGPEPRRHRFPALRWARRQPLLTPTGPVARAQPEVVVSRQDEPALRAVQELGRVTVLRQVARPFSMKAG